MLRRGRRRGWSGWRSGCRRSRGLRHREAVCGGRATATRVEPGLGVDLGQGPIEASDGRIIDELIDDVAT